MRNILIFTFIVAISALFSCEKNNYSPVIETIEPLPYFPAFPGSYWIYDSGDTMKVDSYVEYEYNTADYNSKPNYKTYKFPRLILSGIYNDYVLGDDIFTYVNEYSILKSSASGNLNPPFKELLSLTEGSEFTIGAAYKNSKETGKTIKVDTTITIGTTQYNDVIVTIQFNEECIYETGGTPESCATIREYYAKNVGLIKRERKDFGSNTVFVDDINLVEYYIAP
ncbi:hypothetical protein ERX46_07720 [Brumimicrobium glaciale]|uniref:Uncharacterized protein n=1 Tax=Brumimicrobium glaciale TaxID=200475 RepID=A0A4Q4KKF4_9FLAO|nr:hypothetical protein [Brumimicrobium glaciale]RYM33843.1 hypothetical protein ERX46_07720 [Brumimicrobium glaciale]